MCNQTATKKTTKQVEKCQRIQDQHTRPPSGDTETGKDVSNKRIIVINTIMMKKKKIKKN